MIDRRRFALLTALFTLGLRARPAAAQQQLPEGSARADLGVPVHDMSVWPSDWMGDEQVVLLAYPGMTALDLVGPQYMFATLVGATVRVAAKTLDPVRTDTGLVIVPDVTLAEAHEAPTVLFAPGGISGTLNALEDAETVDFLASRGERAAFVTSVCTGALLLGQAGLLDGYRATTHWLALPALDAFGAEAVDARVVQDRNRVTGGGVTAGLDFGLTLLAALRGTPYAQAVQLLAEYAPEPPLNAGTLATAPPEVARMMQGMFPGFEANVRAVAATRQG